jgi:hypothetical protein
MPLDAARRFTGVSMNFSILRLRSGRRLGKGHDFVEPSFYFVSSHAHAERGAVEIDILAPGQLGVAPRAGAPRSVQQAAHPAVDPSPSSGRCLGPALGRLGDARQDLEQRAPCPRVVPRVARAVATERSPRSKARGRPMTPTTSPRCTSKETSFRAQIVSFCHELHELSELLFRAIRGFRLIRGRKAHLARWRGRELTQGWITHGIS